MCARILELKSRERETMCRLCQKTDSPDSSSSSSVETEFRPSQFTLILQFSGATLPSGDSGASTSKGDADASNSIGDSGASTFKGDFGASTSIGDSGASTFKGDFGTSTSIGDSGASTSKGDAGASTSKGDSVASTSKGDAGSSTSSENEFYGPAGAAAMLFLRDRERRDEFVNMLYIFRVGLGSQTISVAEYRGLILGLKETIRRGYTNITVLGSSDIVVNQFLGNREINDPELRSLCDEALELRSRFESFSIKHIAQKHEILAMLAEFSGTSNLSLQVDCQATQAISLPDGKVEVISFVD